MNLNSRAWLSLAFLALVLGLILFVTAGTIRYWQGWTYLAVFFASSALLTRHIMRQDPELLERRMRGGPAGEQRPGQKVIQLLAALGFIGLHIVPALDRRYRWSAVPLYAVVAGNVLVAIGFYLIFLVYKADSFASATIEVAADQRV